MKITLTKPMLRNSVMLSPGAVLDVPDRSGEFFVQGGWATRTDGPLVPPATSPEPEKAPGSKTKSK